MTERANSVGRVQPDDSDADALARIARGEVKALGVLYDRHYVSVLRFAQSLTRHASDAEDVAQETFLTAARIAHGYDGRPSCRPWLIGIAARLVMHRGRSVARLRRFLARLTEQAPESLATPHDTYVNNERNRTLEQALGRLSEPKRVVLMMAEMEGLTGPEIAEALAIPVGTVWTRLHHARSELRKTLERGGP